VIGGIALGIEFPRGHWAVSCPCLTSPDSSSFERPLVAWGDCSECLRGDHAWNETNRNWVGE
jgi:hypothetical protein